MQFLHSIFPWLICHQLSIVLKNSGMLLLVFLCQRLWHIHKVQNFNASECPFFISLIDTECTNFLIDIFCNVYTGLSPRLDWLEPIVWLLSTLSVDPLALKSGSKILPESTWEAIDGNSRSNSFFNEVDAPVLHVFEFCWSADSDVGVEHCGTDPAAVEVVGSSCNGFLYLLVHYWWKK